MATIPQDMTLYIRAINQDPTALSELRAATPNVNELRGLLQGLENWFELPATRLAAKAAMQAEAGKALNAVFAKKLIRIWMQLKWGGE